MYIGLHVKYRLLLSDCNETRIFSTDFRKILISNFMKIRQPSGSRAPCQRADMTNVSVAFRNFGNASKKGFLKKSISPCGLVPHDKLKRWWWIFWFRKRQGLVLSIWTDLYIHCNTTHLHWVTDSRRFGTTQWPHLQRSKYLPGVMKDDVATLSRKAGNR